MDAESTSIKNCPVVVSTHTFYSDYLRAKGEWPFPRWYNKQIIRFSFIRDKEDILKKLGDALI